MTGSDEQRPAPPFDFGVLYDCPTCGGRELSSSAAYPGQHWRYEEGENILCGPLVPPTPESLPRFEVRELDPLNTVITHYADGTFEVAESLPVGTDSAAPYDPDEIMNAEEAVWDAIHGLFEADAYPANWDTQFHVIEAALERVSEASRRDGAAGAEWARAEERARFDRAYEQASSDFGVALNDEISARETAEQRLDSLRRRVAEERKARGE